MGCGDGVASKGFIFRLKSFDGKGVDIAVNGGRYRFINLKNRIIIVNIFATWCPPCIGEIPHLNALQRKYKDKIDVLGILLYDNELGNGNLKRFIKDNRVEFFISNSNRENSRFTKFLAPKLRLKPNFSIPLTIMFVDGRYFTHYEGSVPEEMVESDIKQATLILSK